MGKAHKHSIYRESAIENASAATSSAHLFLPILYRPSLTFAALAILFILGVGWFFFRAQPIKVEGLAIAHQGQFYGYLPIRLGEKIYPGIKVTIEISNTTSSGYEMILGDVLAVSKSRINEQKLDRQIAYSALLSHFFNENEPLIELVIAPKQEVFETDKSHRIGKKDRHLHIVDGALYTFRAIIPKSDLSLTKK